VSGHRVTAVALRQTPVTWEPIMPRESVVVDPLFPRRLRDLRQAAGMSLRELAKASLSSKSHLHDFEMGHKVPSLDTVKRVDQALAAGGELIRMVVPIGGWKDPRLRRRSFVGWATALAVGVPQAACLVSQSYRPLTDPVVTEARLRTARLRRLDDYLGGVDTYPIYAAEIDATAAAVRDSRGSEAAELGLLGVLAEQAQMAGFSAFDAGWQVEAERLFRLSLAAAQDAGNTALVANALTFLGYQKLAVEGRGGVGFSTASCELVRCASPRVRALQFERRAWAHAIEGQPDDAEASLEAAEAALCDEHDDRPDADWAMWVDGTEVQIMAGRCWAVLHRPLRAISVLDGALRAYDDTHGRDKALYLTFLARAYVDANEVEQACEVARTAMNLASGVASIRPREYMDALIQRLQPYRAVAGVAELTAYAAEWTSQSRSTLGSTRDSQPLRQRSGQL
jgi:transcriptional regulator with XRE-family HTH domain